MSNTFHVLYILSTLTILSCYFSNRLWETFTVSDKDVKTDPGVSPTEMSTSQQDSSQKHQAPSALTRNKVIHRSLQLLLTAVTGLLYVGEAIALAIYSKPKYIPGSVDENLAFTLFGSLVWLILFLGLFDLGLSSGCRSFQRTWIVAAMFEMCLLVMNLAYPASASQSLRIIQRTFQSLRFFFQISLIATEYIQPFARELGSDEEVVPLLPETEQTNLQKKEEKDEDNQMSIERLTKNWWLYVKGFKLFLPIIWPKTARLHLNLLGVVLCIVAERFLNVAVPLSLGNVVQQLGLFSGSFHVPWGGIFFFIVLRLLESSAGFDLVRTVLWSPIDLSATASIKRAAYNHLMSLSSDYHDSKKTDVALLTIHRGTQITDLLDTVLFEFLPMVADLVISISVFWVLFDTYVAFTVAVVVVLYLWSAMKGLTARTNLHRKYIKVWEAEWYSMTESIKCWDSVSHFGRISYEMDNFRDKTSDTAKVALDWQFLSQFLSATRSVILLCGLFAGSCLVAHRVVEGVQDVGNFVVFVTYWGQLSSPLQFFANSFQRISRQLVDAEKLLQIFEKKSSIQDRDGAGPFIFKGGAVEFKSVSFSYDSTRKVTENVSFHAAPGKIIAFVGETGCGKSTLFKLLFRFYDPIEGTILIDGQDLKSVKTETFRQYIGVVPQDPALFNKSIRENLRYSNLEVTDEQIEEACKAVALHEKIMSFTKGYDEIVGERGTKLSGGEKQRVAIARAILKNPRILLLDEATSSVDSTTEAQIQASLNSLCTNRTTFVIAHRLSTIVNADQVIVMDNGKIVESGTHASLIKQKGPYTKLWTSQLSQHIEGLRGKSRSRSRGPTRKEILVSDLNPGDEEATKLLGLTVANEVYLDNESYGISSHPTSHQHETRGRTPFEEVGQCLHNSKPLALKSSKQPDLTISKSLPSSQTLPTLNADAPAFVPMRNHGPTLTGADGQDDKTIRSPLLLISSSTDSKKLGSIIATDAQKYNSFTNPTVKRFEINGRRKQSASEPLHHNLIQDSKLNNDEWEEQEQNQTQSKFGTKPRMARRTVSAMAKANTEVSSGEGSTDATESRGNQKALRKAYGLSNGHRRSGGHSRVHGRSSKIRVFEGDRRGMSSSTTNGSGQPTSEESQPVDGVHSPLMKVPVNSPVQDLNEERNSTDGGFEPGVGTSFL